jgi:glycosyltransferase involved in cell wall biosynthesis
MSRLSVFVHLSYGLDAEKWREKYEAGLVPDEVPYGYHHAENRSYLIRFSSDKPENKVMNICRRAVSRILGFDVIHAWRNRKGIFNCDVIWTHTEREHLAVALLMMMLPRRKRPRLIAQSIWLFDDWKNIPVFKRLFYLALMKKADVLTVLSTSNLRVARKLLPKARVELVKFGISLDSFPISRSRNITSRPHKPCRVLSLGNDRDRDWNTLVTAFKNNDAFRVKIASSGVAQSLLKGVNNIEVVRPRSLHEIRNLYRWADVVVVPLRRNLHASGITVILEATTLGIPVVCTNVGGLRTYFPATEVNYVPPNQPDKLFDKVIEVIDNYGVMTERVHRAQQRIIKDRLTTEGFADRHCAITQDILYPTIGGSTRKTENY